MSNCLECQTNACRRCIEPSDRRQDARCRYYADIVATHRKETPSIAKHAEKAVGDRINKQLLLDINEKIMRIRE